MPTPLRKTKDPDMSYIVSAVEEIAKYLHPGHARSSSSRRPIPGTTDEVVRPMLEASGLKAGEDFFLAFSPERVDPGNPTFQTHNMPKVVGGITPACAELAGALYGSAIETVVPVSSTRVAEMVKLLENTFRAMNIGLVNELALMCDRMGINVWEVIDAAETKPFGFMPFYPGPGPGRPLHPDRSVLPLVEGEADRLRGAVHRAGGPHQRRRCRTTSSTRSPKRSTPAARRSTARRSSSPASRTRRDIDDMRESPALDVMGLLHARGAQVAYVDPCVPEVHGREWSGGFDIKAVDMARGSIGAVRLRRHHHRPQGVRLRARSSPKRM